MNELKTLKDLEIVGTYSNGKYYHSERHEVVEIKDLRQEAINDIKEISKAIIYPYGKDIPMLDDSNKLAKFTGAIEYIKWKNNITEEDLNEEFCACGNSKDSDEEVCKECK